MIDIIKQYRTRDGREVRIYATDGEDRYPIHGAVKTKNGDWSLMFWTSTGKAYNSAIDSIYDLIEVKPRIKREVWLNVYPDPRDDAVHSSKEGADTCAMLHRRIACVKLTIDCEEGGGVCDDC